MYRLSGFKQRYVRSISKMVSDVRITEGSPLRAMPADCMNQFMNVGCETSLMKIWDHGDMYLGKVLEQHIGPMIWALL